VRVYRAVIPQNYDQTQHRQRQVPVDYLAEKYMTRPTIVPVSSWEGSLLSVAVWDRRIQVVHQLLPSMVAAPWSTSHTSMERMTSDA